MEAKVLAEMIALQDFLIRGLFARSYFCCGQHQKSLVAFQYFSFMTVFWASFTYCIIIAADTYGILTVCQALL